jgi:hypothetical protein
MLALVLVAAAAVAPAKPVVTITRAELGGHESLVLRNDLAEVVVVPAWGRIMRFALRDGGGGPFWSHPAVAGAGKLAPDADGWVNVGGDKAWPAPQADWPKLAGKGWPPPATFDSMLHTGWVKGREVVLVSEIDPAYGIRVRRTIALDPRAPVMTVETTFEKVRGAPVRVAVWTITQLAAPERVGVLLPERSAFPGGHVAVLPDPPKDLRVDGRVLSLARDPDKKTMIGSDGSALAWVGEGPGLLVEHKGSKLAGVGVVGGGAGAGEWPNGGVHAQVYTSPVPDAKYVELELLDRLRDLRAGQRATMTVTYTLVPRKESDPGREVARVLTARP